MEIVSLFSTNSSVIFLKCEVEESIKLLIRDRKKLNQVDLTFALIFPFDSLIRLRVVSLPGKFLFEKSFTQQ